MVRLKSQIIRHHEWNEVILLFEDVSNIRLLHDVRNDEQLLRHTNADIFMVTIFTPHERHTRL